MSAGKACNTPKVQVAVVGCVLKRVACRGSWLIWLMKLSEARPWQAPGISPGANLLEFSGDEF